VLARLGGSNSGCVLSSATTSQTSITAAGQFNHSSGIALATPQTLVVLHLLAEGVGEVDDHLHVLSIVEYGKLYL